jgi:hypothetical protein
VNDIFSDSLKIQTEHDQARLDFIRTDLEMCLTFATVVETEWKMANREHAVSTLAKAEKGYSDMMRFFSEATGVTPEVEKDIRLKFEQLRERLDGLQRLVKN